MSPSSKLRQKQRHQLGEGYVVRLSKRTLSDLMQICLRGMRDRILAAQGFHGWSSMVEYRGGDWPPSCQRTDLVDKQDLSEEKRESVYLVGAQ